MFTASVRKYTGARKLTPRMLNELIEKIEVHQSEKIDGKTVQRLTIHYNCIGNIEIPDLEKLPENNVSVHTRQGVDVHFAYVASKKSNKKTECHTKPFKFCKNTQYGASVLTELNEKRSKIKGFRQSINGINLKIKYFSFQNTLRY